MKKERLYVLLFTIVISLIILAPFILADNDTSTTSPTSTSNIDKAYLCLSDKVNNKCSTLSLEEQIFSLLALI